MNLCPTHDFRFYEKLAQWSIIVIWLKFNAFLSYQEEEDEEQAISPPLYLTEFVLEPNQLLFSPDEDEFQDVTTEVIKRFQDAVLSVQNLVPDTYFDAFTRWGTDSKILAHHIRKLFV